MHLIVTIELPGIFAQVPEYISVFTKGQFTSTFFENSARLHVQEILTFIHGYISYHLS